MRLCDRTAPPAVNVFENPPCFAATGGTSATSSPRGTFPMSPLAVAYSGCGLLFDSLKVRYFVRSASGSSSSLGGPTRKVDEYVVARELVEDIGKVAL